VTITASTNLTEAEIERMVKEAREHETEDRKRRELVEARNMADNLIYQTEKTLRELGDKVSADERKRIEDQINELREAIKGDNTQQIKSKSDALQHALHALSQQLYAQQSTHQAGGGNGSAPGPGPEDEGEVVEGEFREA
jgi:molecular chaperone DnaK